MRVEMAFWSPKEIQYAQQRNIISHVGCGAAFVALLAVNHQRVPPGNVNAAPTGTYCNASSTQDAHTARFSNKL